MDSKSFVLFSSRLFSSGINIWGFKIILIGVCERAEFEESQILSYFKYCFKSTLLFLDLPYWTFSANKMRVSAWSLLIITATSLHSIAGCVTSCRSVATENGDRVTCRCIAAAETWSKKQGRRGKPGTGTGNILRNHGENDRSNFVGGTMAEALDTLNSAVEKTLAETLVTEQKSVTLKATEKADQLTTDTKTPDFHQRRSNSVKTPGQKNIADTHVARKRSAKPRSASSSTDQVIIVDKRNCVRRCFRKGGKYRHCIVMRGCMRRSTIEQAQERQRQAAISEVLRKIHWQWLWVSSQSMKRITSRRAIFNIIPMHKNCGVRIAGGGGGLVAAAPLNFPREKNSERKPPNLGSFVNKFIADAEIFVKHFP